jgi:peptidyl-prolyl cis-trans isomerase A (cyclophilin A)
MRAWMAVLTVGLLALALPAFGQNPQAILTTSAGRITCELFQEKTPIAVANFIGLAKGTKDWINPVSKATKHNTPLYNGTIFHRVIPGFMIQGGDPAGNGGGGPGYSFKDEIVPGLYFDRPGRLAMANSGPNTNGSQFFITDGVAAHLNGHFTIFGQCAPVSVIRTIAAAPRDADDRPFHPVRLIKVTIVPAGAAPAHKPAAAAHKPAARNPATHTGAKTSH